MSKKWNQSDTATLIRDQAAGGRPIETAQKLGQRVGFVFVKAASLRRPFRFDGALPAVLSTRHDDAQPILRGPNGVVQAVFNAVGQTVVVTSPIQTALERMLSAYEKRDDTAAVIQATIPPSVTKQPTPVPAIKPSAVVPAAVHDEVTEPPAVPPALPAATQAPPTVAYLVAGDDAAIEAFRRSVERGIEPKPPEKRAHVSVVTAGVAAVKEAPVKPLEADRHQPGVGRHEPAAKLTERKVPEVAKPAVVPTPVPATASAPIAVVRTPSVPQPAPAAISKPPVEPIVQAPAPQPQPQPQPIAIDPQPNVDKAVDNLDREVVLPIDPETGEILTRDAEAHRRRDSLVNVSIAKRESDGGDGYKPTAAERRYRMKQLREAARRVHSPSGRIVSEAEGLKRIMSILG